MGSGPNQEGTLDRMDAEFGQAVDASPAAGFLGDIATPDPLGRVADLAKLAKAGILSPLYAPVLCK